MDVVAFGGLAINYTPNDSPRLPSPSCLSLCSVCFLCAVRIFNRFLVNVSNFVPNLPMEKTVQLTKQA